MAQLLLDYAVVDLLSGIAGGNIYAGIVPEEKRPPFVSFQRISGFKVRDINGPSGLARTIFQIDIYSNDNAECRQLADDVRKILDGFSGTVTIGPDSIIIGGVSMQAERDFIEDNVDPKLYRASVDYLFKYEEDIA